MRTSKYRGKRKDTGEWVSGGIHQFEEDTVEKIYITIQDILIPAFVEVHPDTAGEYTGLEDRNGREIFEGDIILWRHTESSGLHCKQNTVVFFEEGIIVSRRIDSFYPGGLEPTGSYLYYMCSIFDKAIQEYPQRNYFYEVIGNIHDNPELLEEENDCE